MAGLSKENPLKAVFNPASVTRLSEALARVRPDFPARRFADEVIPGLEGRSFSERSASIREALRKYLPRDFPEAVGILVAALGPELPDSGVAGLESFIVMPQCAFIAKYGRSEVELSLDALREMTKRFTAEGDLRAFLEVDYETTMKHLRAWCEDPSPHVRRLVSEGTRPRLPLAGRIRRFQGDPTPVISLLERLRRDPSLYVRRSVANNINDIAKDNADIALRTLAEWSTDESEENRRLLRHAARTLIRQGNPEALRIFGYAPEPEIAVADFAQDLGVVEVGGSGAFRCLLRSVARERQELVVDYVVHFVKANKSLRPKIFKHRKMALDPGSVEAIQIRHRFRDTSGRRHYPGDHVVELQVNGKRYGGWKIGLVPSRQDQPDLGGESRAES